MLAAPQSESALGMEYFFTDTPPMKGKIKTYPEDFLVEEIPINYSRLDNPPRQNPHTVIRIKATDWESNRLFHEVSRVLTVNPRKIAFSGTKDKRAVTIQDIYLGGYFSRSAAKRIESLNDVEVLDVCYTPRKLGMGDLIGNRFEILIRDTVLQVKDAEKVASEAFSTIRNAGGVPNYFGVQRFGIVRPITHTIGRYMVLGEFEKAVMTYIGSPQPGEVEHIRKARARIEAERDFEAALEYYPQNLSYEMGMIMHLNKQPDDWVGALLTLPHNLRLMFVHAYQSYLFNKILSRRIEAGLPLNRPVVGDLVVSVDSYGLPHHKKWHQVNERNLSRLDALAKKGRVFVSAPAVGYDVALSSGEPGEIERKVLEKEGIDWNGFKMPGMPDVSSAGIRREILSPVKDLSYKINDEGLFTSFRLNKGCYATVVLRELMKSDDIRSY